MTPSGRKAAVIPAACIGDLSIESTLNITPPIRLAQEGDVAEIARLCEVLGYPVFPEDMAARVSSLLNSERHWIAVAGGHETALLGWVAAEHRLLLESGERVEIVGLVVDPAARRKGIGNALVSGAEHWASSRGVSTVFVRSNIARTESHDFYDRIGYERTKTQHAYTKIL
jgi:GNAT superfamily N-acetyltransferase